MNKNGSMVKLTGNAVFVIIMFVGFTFYFYISNKEYSQQASTGQEILNNFTVYAEYKSPKGGDTQGIVLATLNYTSFNDRIDAKVSYVAFSHNRSKNKLINELVISIPADGPFSLPQQSLDTSKLYSELGNNAEICISIDLTYKELNWIRIFKGSPNRQLNECKTFIGEFESISH
jgi:hypothetical protein